MTNTFKVGDKVRCKRGRIVGQIVSVRTTAKACYYEYLVKYEYGGSKWQHERDLVPAEQKEDK